MILGSFLAMLMTVQPSTNESSRRPITYKLAVWAEGKSCRVAIDGRPVPSARLERELRKLPKTNSSEVHVSAAVETPYRCIGGVIYSAQKAGFIRIGFVTDEARP